MDAAYPTRRDWKEFEVRVAEVLEETGGAITREPAIGGARLDLVAEFANQIRGGRMLRIGVEVHYYRKRAGRQTIEPFHALMESLVARGFLDAGVLVVNTGFAETARRDHERETIGFATLETIASTVRRIFTTFRERSAQDHELPLARHRLDQIDPNKQLFVMMPFAGKYLDTFVSGIVPAADDAGYTAFRVDQIVHNRDIMEVVRESINGSHRQLAITTDANANVLYELGIAHALGKEPILAATQGKKLPFDISGMKHILYTSSVSLRSQLPPYLER